MNLFASIDEYLNTANSSYTDAFVDIDISGYPGSVKKPLRVMRNNRFMVQVYNETDSIIRLTVCRTAIDEYGRWIDGITWDELQKIKNQMGYADKDAVEVFPRDMDMVNVANMRHLWILPELLPFVWRDSKNSACKNVSEQLCQK